MRVYNYHPTYRYYTGFEDADSSPLEPGIYLTPAHSTSIEPPSCDDGEIQIFYDTYWEVIEDKRGTYYSKSNQSKYLHEDPTSLPPDEYTELRPPAPGLAEEIIWNGSSWEAIPKSEQIPLEEMTSEQKLLLNTALTVEELKTLLNI